MYQTINFFVRNFIQMLHPNGSCKSYKGEKKGKKLTKNSKLLFKVCHICIGRSLSIIDYCNFKICIGVWHPLIMTKLSSFGLSICHDSCSFFDFLFAFATLLLPCKDFCCRKDFAFGLRSLLMCLPSLCYLLSRMLYS